MLAVLKCVHQMQLRFASADSGGTHLLFTTDPNLLSLPPGKCYFLLRHAGTALQNPTLQSIDG